MLRTPFVAAVALLAAASSACASGYQDFNQGVAAINRDDNSAALQLLTKALSEPDLPDHLKPAAHLERGEIYMDSNKFEAALTDFNAALQLKPDSFRAWLDRAGAEEGENKFA